MAAPPGILSPANITGSLPRPDSHPGRLITAGVLSLFLAYLTGYAIIRANSTVVRFGTGQPSALITLPTWRFLRHGSFIDRVYSSAYQLEAGLTHAWFLRPEIQDQGNHR